MTSDQALVANTLLYHVYSGDLMSNGSGHQILRSALNDSMYVQLREFGLHFVRHLVPRHLFDVASPVQLATSRRLASS